MRNGDTWTVSAPPIIELVQVGTRRANYYLGHGYTLVETGIESHIAQRLDGPGQWIRSQMVHVVGRSAEVEHVAYPDEVTLERWLAERERVV